MSLRLRAAIVSVALFVVFLAVWLVGQNVGIGMSYHRQLTHRGYVTPKWLEYFLAACGYLIAVIVAIPLGFLIGTSPLISRALDPFIQILKPISPLAWMPLALYTIKDSALSSIFVIFICSLWPMLINTAFGVGAVRKEWLDVARTLEVGTLRRAFTIILPAAAPTASKRSAAPCARTPT